MKVNKERQNKRKKARKKKRGKERLTERDLKELMGVGRPVYRRGKGGAFRQR
ncbi:phage protein [Anoxybacillus flavithermus]|uniref:Phage protein n=1 Tax=Anoxybacillus flavithermus TaxID=33934 RepID=A0A094IXE8_9BACL|nr:phage protein [Anoxybacillus flavithermus]